jgi:hypothetical protein
MSEETQKPDGLEYDLTMVIDCALTVLTTLEEACIMVMMKSRRII